MWGSRQTAETEESAPGIKERLSAAWAAARDLVATRIEIFKVEASEKGTTFARGAVAFAIALALAWLAILLLTALIAVLLARLFGSTWAGLLGAFVLYLLGAGAAAFIGIKAFKNFRPFDFSETRRGLHEDWRAVRSALQPPPEPEAEEDLEQRFRAGSE
jgi:uncharacterized membrane protein YqjE